MLVRLYGITGTYTSQATVTRGFARALRSAGVLAGIYSLNESNDWDPDDEIDEGRAEFRAGANAPIAIHTGPLSVVDRMAHWGAHRERWTMVAPNSSALPRDLMQKVNACSTAILGPSAWACGVIRRYTDLPVYLTQHGIDPEYRPLTSDHDFEWPIQATEPGSFVVRHFSTSERERKGTRELISAWKRLRGQGSLPPGAELILTLNQHVLASLDPDLQGLAEHAIRVEERAGYGRGRSPEEMAFVFSRTHLVVQPSRGEAFGLIPLEALACGVPVVATRATGHMEWSGGIGSLYGFVPVATGSPAPIDDLPEEDSVAPSLAVEDVEEALRGIAAAYPELRQAARANAGELSRMWQWEARLRLLIQHIKEVRTS